MAHYPADTFQEATEIAIEASNQLHSVINGDANAEVTVEDGSKIPSVRKAMVDSLYFKPPIAWAQGEYEDTYNQLREFVDGDVRTWWFAKGATVSPPVLMTTNPATDPNWTLWSAVTLNAATYETQKRLAAEAGLNMVGSFLLGGTITNVGDVVFYETDGKYYGWGGSLPKVVAVGSTPATSGGIGAGAWVDRTDVALRGELSASDGARLSLSTVATAYGISFSSLSPWTPSEVVSRGVYRWYDNQIWAPNSDSVSCGTSPDYTNFHQIYPWLAQNEVALSQFGVITNGMDVTSILTRAINYAKNNGWLTVVNDFKGTLYVSSALPAMNSASIFKSVKYRTISRLECVLKFDGNGSSIAAAPYGFNYYAGSGGIFGVGIWDAYLDGGTTVDPIYVKGFGGLIVKNSTIFGKVAARLSNDIGAGTFTEFFKFSGCDIHCVNVLTMYRGAGDRSFHGCGWDDDCVINASGNLVELGVLGENLMTQQVVWYNGSVGGSIFPLVAGKCFVYSPNLYNVAIYGGDIKFETNFTFRIGDINQGFYNLFCGTVQDHGGYVSFGNALPCEVAGLQSNGSPYYMLKTYTSSGVKLGNGSDVLSIGTTGIGSDDGAGSLLSVTCSAQNYEYQQLYLITGRITQSISPSFVLLGTGRSFNSAGYGAPTLRWYNDTLQVYNANWLSAEVTVKWKIIGNSRYV